MKTQRFFGTDGVRGVANHELTCEMAFALGEAAVRLLGPKLVIGRDTRISGSMLEAALIAGITSHGGEALLAGVIPTPAVALLTRQLGASGGVVISASHNPPEYNGIKFFDAEGYKLSQELEDRFEAALHTALGTELAEAAAGKEGGVGGNSGASDGGGAGGGNDSGIGDDDTSAGKASASVNAAVKPARSRPIGTAVGVARPIEGAHERYINHAVDILAKQKISLKGLTVAVDCGNGASCNITPEALRRLGAKVVVINDEGDGSIINVDCGSTNLDQLAQLIKESKADVGIAHDGDADRTIAMSASGMEIDGDYIEAICALDRRATRGLPGNTLVSTVMCNIGFVQAMEKAGLKIIQTPVGDANVLAAMREGGYAIGGEQSGHMIFSEYNSTGDGLITALMLLAAMQRSGKPLDILAVETMSKYPQTLINVHVANKQLLDTNKAIAVAIQAGEAELQKNGGGRVLVRASGTEPLVRVMVEAAGEEIAERIAKSLAGTVEKELT